MARNTSIFILIGLNLVLAVNDLRVDLNFDTSLSSSVLRSYSNLLIPTYILIYFRSQYIKSK